MAARVAAPVRAGKVNGLQRPAPTLGRTLRVPRHRPGPLLVAGAGLYAVCLAVPVVLHQMASFVAGGAVLGTVLLLFGLHTRWTEARGRVP